MKKIGLFIASMMVVTLMTSCGAKKVSLMTDKNVAKSSISDVLKTEGLWIKDKGKKFDVAIRMTNVSKKTLLVMRSDMIFKKGQHIGNTPYLRNELHVPSDNPSFLVFEPGEVKQFHTTSYLDTKYKDKDFYFIVENVYENISQDLIIPKKGDILAKDIELHIKL